MVCWLNGAQILVSYELGTPSTQMVCWLNGAVFLMSEVPPVGAVSYARGTPVTQAICWFNGAAAGLSLLVIISFSSVRHSTLNNSS